MLILIETVSLWDKVAVSGPLAAFQLLVLAAMYKYFQKEIDKKDAIIRQKDTQMEVLNQKLVDITERFLQATLKHTEIIEGVKEFLKETLKRP